MIEMKCDGCGATLEMDDKGEMLICPNCGKKIMLSNFKKYRYEKVEEAKITESNNKYNYMNKKLEEESRRFSTKRTLIISAAFITLLIIAGGIIFAQNRAFTRRLAHQEELTKEQLQAMAEKFANQKVIEVTKEIKVTEQTVREVIAPAGELVTYKYYYSDIGKYEKAHRVGNIKVPFTTDESVYTYSGTISVGIEMSDISISVNEDARQVNITLKEPVVLYNTIDEGSFEVYDIKNSVFTSTSLGEYVAFTGDLKKNQLEKIKNMSEFWESAKDNTENIITGMISGVTSDYKIHYVWTPNAE